MSKRELLEALAGDDDSVSLYMELASVTEFRAAIKELTGNPKTLRDYFAAEALPAVLALGFTVDGAEAMAEEAKAFKLEVVDYQAQMAYQIADAMLKARDA